MAFGDWLDERIGHRRLISAFADDPVPGGARTSYVFGSALVFVLGLQATTGVLLASFYAPSSSSAWASVAYIQQNVRLGWFIRGLHSAGASALIILVAMHMLQVTVTGAYRRPREVNWYLGLGLAALLLAFALTGYLLPWDERGYFATQVATSLLGLVPALGPWLRRLLQGGPEYGNLTLTHFYALHVIVLPAATALLVVAHVALMRRHGVTPPARWSQEELAARAQPFWPHQALRDLVAMALVLALMVLAVAHTHGTQLAAPADPSSSYDARPEWYFLPLYQLLKYFPGRLEIVAALGAPLVAVGLLALLPLVDRGESRRPAERKAFIGLVVLLLFAAACLGAAAADADRHNGAYQLAKTRADARAARALRLSRQGVPPAGGTAVFDNDPLSRGRRLFAAHCAGCHLLAGVGGEGKTGGPALDGWSSRAWLRDFLLDPAGARFYGRTKVHGMKPVKERGADLAALVEWVYAEGGGSDFNPARVDKGKQLFSTSGCDSCHDSDGTSDGDGVPNLGGRARPEWIRAFIEDPGAPRFFGRQNQMTAFAGKLSPSDLDALSALLLAERAR